MKKPKPRPKRPDEDEAQSQRFIEAAKAIEAAGEPNLTGDEFERVFRTVTPSRTPKRT